MSEDSLRQLIDALPEIYQPLYGLPEYSSSRSDSTRDTAIERVVTAARHVLERPLRILDLGTAQGFYAMTLAARGHHVTGIDYEPANVAVAEALAERHPGLDVRFLVGDVTEVARLVDLDSYDFVLALSVLHHVTYRSGHDQARGLVEALAKSVPHLLAEMALRDEPVYWAAAQPNDPRITLAPYAFLRELGRSSTHLSEVARPLMFGSQTHVLLPDGLHPIRSSFTRPHQNVGPGLDGARRYFVLDGVIVKTAAAYDIEVPPELIVRIRHDLRREAAMIELLRSTGHARLPEVVELADLDDETLLARTLLPGTPLDEVIEELTDDERLAITRQLLTELATLEREGLYHSDLRTWNLLWDRTDQTLHLIDYGSIETEPTDVVWPHDARLSALALIVTLWERAPERTGATAPRSSNLSNADMGPLPKDLALAMLSHEDGGAFFGDLARRLDVLIEGGVAEAAPVPLAWRWLASIEAEHDRVSRALDETVRTNAELTGRVAALEVELANRRREAEHLRAEYARLSDELAELSRNADGLHDHAAAVEADRDRIRAELASTAADRDAHAEMLAAARVELAAIRSSRVWQLAQRIQAAGQKVRAIARR